MKKLVLLIALCVSVSVANAADIARYDTYNVRTLGAAGGYPINFASYAEGTVAPCVELATMGKDGFTASGTPASNQFWGNYVIDAGDAFVFTVNVADDYSITLDQLFIGGIQRSSTGPATAIIEAQVDGGSWVTLQNVTVPSGSYANYILDLSGLETVEDSLIIRLEATAAATSSTGSFRVGNYYDGSAYSDFGVTGTYTLVPEPATIALLAMGGLGFIRRRK